MPKPQYFLDRDDDGHWFVIPIAHEDEWIRWCNLDQDSEESWEPPSWAQAVDGNPSRVVFENPRLP